MGGWFVLVVSKAVCASDEEPVQRENEGAVTTDDRHDNAGIRRKRMVRW